LKKPCFFIDAVNINPLIWSNEGSVVCWLPEGGRDSKSIADHDGWEMKTSGERRVVSVHRL